MIGDSQSTPPTPHRSWPRRFLNRLEVGQAVFYAVTLRVWQLLAGIVTLGMMMAYFSQEMQGMYYAFASVVALQMFFELGLSILIINQCSHEWARLSLDDEQQIGGDRDHRSRLISFGRLLFGWYGVASLLFVVATSTGGSLFLASKPLESVDWMAPWLGVVLLSGLLLWSLPFNSVLEGCGQVTEVNRFRLVQAIAANLAVWAVMACGGGLWAAVAATGARVACEWTFLLYSYRRFFAPFWQRSVGPQVSWGREILPLQWRLAVGSIFGYFAYFLFVPVMLAYHGFVVAGQMGPTWTVVTTIQAAAMAWVQTRAPLFGMLVSRGDRTELDRVFFRVAALGIAAYTVAATAFWFLIWGFNVWDVSIGDARIADRVLGPAATAAFLAAALVQTITSSLAFYVRAHKQEPFLWVGVVSNVAIGLAVWQLGAAWGPLGAGIGLLACSLLINLPTHVVLWQQCRAAFASPENIGDPPDRLQS